MAEKILKRKSTITFLSAMLMLLGFPLAGSAIGNAPVSGITVSPEIEQLQLTSAQDNASFKVRITNNTKQAAQIKIGFTDFKSLNNSGGIAFLDQKSTALEKSHGLSSWVHLTTQQLGLEPGISTIVPIGLAGLNGLAVGGHYGAVTYQVFAANPGTNGNRVNINQVLTSLVFLTTAGKGTERLSMPPPPLNGIEFSMPTSLSLFLKNTGNTQTTPRGEVVVYQHNPAVPIAETVLNSNSAMVLPDSTRILETPLTIRAHPWWPHEYHVRIAYRSASATKFSTYNAAFLYINAQPLIITGLLLAVAGYIIARLIRNWSKVATAIKKFRPKHKRD